MAYTPELAAVMLRRQQVPDMIKAGKMIADDVVGIVRLFPERLSEQGIGSTRYTKQ